MAYFSVPLPCKESTLSFKLYFHEEETPTVGIFYKVQCIAIIMLFYRTFCKINNKSKYLFLAMVFSHYLHSWSGTSKLKLKAIDKL